MTILRYVRYNGYYIALVLAEEKNKEFDKINNLGFKEVGKRMSKYIDNINFNFLYINRYVFGKNWVFPESIVPYSLIRIIEKGEAVFFIDDTEFAVKEGQLIYIPCNSRLYSYSTTEDFRFMSVRFTTSVLFEGGDLLSDVYGVPYITEVTNEKEYFDQMMHWVKSDSVARMFIVRGCLFTLLGQLIARCGKNEEYVNENIETLEVYTLKQIQTRSKKCENRIDPRIQIVLDYIVLNPGEKYTPAKLAEMAELSTQRFGSLFKAQVGKTPMTYVRELKMVTAARRLLVSNKNINDISFELGYEDPNYFIKEFKAAFGYTPKQYRKNAVE